MNIFVSKDNESVEQMQETTSKQDDGKPNSLQHLQKSSEIDTEESTS